MPLVPGMTGVPLAGGDPLLYSREEHIEVRRAVDLESLESEPGAEGLEAGVVVLWDEGALDDGRGAGAEVLAASTASTNWNINAILATPSFLDQSRSLQPSVSNSDSLMASFVIKGKVRSPAIRRARVVFPDAGGPETSTKSGSGFPTGLRQLG